MEYFRAMGRAGWSWHNYIVQTSAVFKTAELALGPGIISQYYRFVEECILDSLQWYGHYVCLHSLFWCKPLQFLRDRAYIGLDVMANLSSCRVLVQASTVFMIANNT